MNIFALDKSPKISAQYHCDKHVVKMILESAQMLSTTVHLNFDEKKYPDFDLNSIYKPAFLNHPCRLWSEKSLENWLWLKELAFYLNEEYKFRYEKNINHKSFNMIEKLPIPKLQKIGLTPFAQAMPNEYKHSDSVQAYKNYYIGEKKKFCKYTKREVPNWL